ncbi:MAG: hypothetical protein AAGM38_04635 [Pseudomonadota bacterium]
MMALELVATIVFGVGAAGIAMLFRKLAPSLAPRWLIPIAAGGAMIGFTIWSEYAWFARQSGALPPGIEVATTHAEPSFFRPWTYVTPFVSRFSAVDLSGVLRHEDAPGKLIAQVYSFERFAMTASAPMLFDCSGKRLAPLVDGVSFGEDGRIDGAEWASPGGMAPLVDKACAAPADTAPETAAEQTTQESVEQ